MTSYKPAFDSPYEQYLERNGQAFTVIGVITGADAEHDAEVLPMYRIRFRGRHRDRGVARGSRGVMNDAPLTDAELASLRLIISGPTDNVVRANAWCEEHGAEIQFEDGPVRGRGPGHAPGQAEAGVRRGAAMSRRDPSES